MTLSPPWPDEEIRAFASIGTGDKDTQDRVASGKYPFFVRSQKIERIDSWSFDGEAVLTAGDGVGTGKVFHYIDGKFDYHQRVYRISNFRADVSGRFFYHQFSRNFLARIESLTAKSSVDSVRMETIAGMRIPLPDRAEQERIVRVIDDADALVDALEQLIAKKRAIKQGMLQQLLTGRTRLPGFSASWADRKISSIAVIAKGVQLGRAAMEPGAAIPVWNGGIEPSGFTSRPNVTRGVVTVSEGGNSCGWVGRPDGSFWLGGHCYSLDPKTAGHSVPFLYHRLKAAEPQIMALRVGSGLPNIQKKRLGDFMVSIPTDRREADKIAGILDDADRELAMLSTRVAKFRGIRTGLMQQLLTGRTRLAVGDAS